MKTAETTMGNRKMLNENLAVDLCHLYLIQENADPDYVFLYDEIWEDIFQTENELGHDID